MAKANWKKKIDDHVAQGGTVGKSSWQAGLFGNASKNDVIAYAKKKGYTLGQAWADQAGGLKSQLTAAGQVLSEKELLKISKSTGKDFEKVLEKAVGQGLSIGSKVVNQYQKGAYTDPMLAMTRQGLPEYAMAAGKDSAILQQLRNAGKLDKGSSLFIGSKGSTSTVLPRGGGTQSAAQVAAAPAAPGAAPAPLAAAAAPAPADSGFDFGSFFGDSMSEPSMPDMPSMESFDALSSDFTTPNALMFASLGQSYLADAIRAAQRRQQTRGDFMRQLLGSINPYSQLLSIGGGVNVS